MKHESWIAAVSVSGFIIDRILKYAVLSFPAGKVFSFGVFEFGYFLNPSLFFFPAWRFIPWLALAVLVALIVFLLTHAGTKHLTPNTWSLIPIALGGVSNVFDRFAYGGVIDIIAIRGLGTFNLADFLILWGLVMLLFQKRVE